jgi:hypothetical protein
MTNHIGGEAARNVLRSGLTLNRHHSGLLNNLRKQVVANQKQSFCGSEKVEGV